MGRKAGLGIKSKSFEILIGSGRGRFSGVITRRKKIFEMD